jgi:hypothetical protein
MLALLLFNFSGCKTGGEEAENPVPVLTSLSPWAKAAHMPSFTLTVNGSDFIAGSQIIFNGTARETVFVSSEQLTCTIDTGDLTTGSTVSAPQTSAAQNGDVSIGVTVRNPAPGGGDSEHLLFTIVNDMSFLVPFRFLYGDDDFVEPSLDTDASGVIYLVFKSISNDTGDKNIYIINSFNGGESWDNSAPVYQTAGSCSNPRIAVDSQGNVNMACFTEGRLFFTRSTGDNFNWSSLAPLSSPAILPDEIFEPGIAVDPDGNICTVWAQQERGGNVAVYFTRSSDNGVSWSPAIDIFTGWTPYNSVYSPVIAVDNNSGVYVTWTAKADGGAGEHVFFNYSHDSGANWNPIATRFPLSTMPDIAIGPDGGVNLVMSSEYGPSAFDVLLYMSSDRGVNWSGGTSVTSNQWGTAPRLLIDGAGNFNLIYLHNFDFMHSRSIDGGISWSGESAIFNDNTGLDAAVDPWGNIIIIYPHPSGRALMYVTNSRYL